MHPGAPAPISGHRPKPGFRSLMVFLNNQCNMDCPNCFTPLSHSGIQSHRLEWEDFKSAIDAYMALPSGLEPKNIVILGGEPFLSHSLLVKAVEYLDAAVHQAKVDVYTNGTLLDEKKFEPLRRDWLRLFVSLDGNGAGNDAYRVFTRSKESVYEAVMPRLKNLPLEEMGVFAVLHPKNLDGLLEAVKHFARRGFGSIDFCIDMMTEWTDADIDRLRSFSESFASFYETRTREDGRIPFSCEVIEQAISNGNGIAKGVPWWTDAGEIVLGADGRYYPCEGAVRFPYERVAPKLSLNRARDGAPNWEARRSFLRDADAFLASARSHERWQIISPRVFYTTGLIEGVDKRDRLENFHRFSQAFLLELLKLASRLQDHPDFKRKYLDPDAPYAPTLKRR